jgi:hypothetical protein
MVFASSFVPFPSFDFSANLLIIGTIKTKVFFEISQNITDSDTMLLMQE